MVLLLLVFVSNIFIIDYEDLECKIVDLKVKVMLLCNFYNFVGRVWKCEELVCIGEICIWYDVMVVLDEIYCELVFLEYCYILFVFILENFCYYFVVCIFFSKVFNIVGL